MESKEKPLKWKTLETILRSPGSATALKKEQFNNLGTGALSVGIFKVKPGFRKSPIVVKIGKLDHAKPFNAESEILFHLKEHPNIRSLIEPVDILGEYIFMKLEYVPGTDLFSLLAERTPPIPRKKLDKRASHSAVPPRKYICRCILNALEYLHAVGVVHNDLKPENVIVSTTTSLDDVTEQTVVKLVDFGLACEINPTEEAVCSGSAFYVPPEKYLGNYHTNPAGDIYSFGIVFFAVFTGTLPYDVSDIKSRKSLVKKIKAARRQAGETEKGLFAYYEIKQIFLESTSLTAERRKSATQLMELDLFAKANENLKLTKISLLYGE